MTFGFSQQRRGETAMSDSAGTSMHKRIASVIFGMLMFFIVLSSAFFIAFETNHECTGEDCPICELIIQCVNTLHQIGEWIAPLSAAVIPIVFMLYIAHRFDLFFLQETLISRKVRLND